MKNWGRLFEINDVVSKRFVKISNMNIANPLLFFVETTKNNSVFDNVVGIYLTSSHLNDIVRLTML